MVSCLSVFSKRLYDQHLLGAASMGRFPSADRECEMSETASGRRTGRRRPLPVIHGLQHERLHLTEAAIRLSESKPQRQVPRLSIPRAARTLRARTHWRKSSRAIPASFTMDDRHQIARSLMPVTSRFLTLPLQHRPAGHIVSPAIMSSPKSH
jgi:hypothetical protein